MNDLMIDLETLDTGSKSIVLSIGACFFDINTKTIGETFYGVPTLQEQYEKGRTHSQDTLNWWGRQSPEARTVLAATKRPVQDVLQEFCLFAIKNSSGAVKPWGNGSTFDITIIESLLNDFNIRTPWRFFDVMDLRTFGRFVAKGAKVEKTGVNHNALDDAISQANYVLKFCK